MDSSFLDKNEENTPIVDAEVIRDDTYSAQREELSGLLKGCLDKNEPLKVHEKPVLTQDDIYRVLHKIRTNMGFSRKERSALTEAGFDLERLYPDL